MMYHVTSEYSPTNQDTIRRMKLAQSTWENQLWKELPIHESTCRRMTDEVGSMPYIMDILNLATNDKKPSDIAVFTNSDICVSSLCSIQIAHALQGTSALYCYRRDFGRLDHPIQDDAIPEGHGYCGSDLYAFRVQWWKAYRDRFPDMLLGREAWDAILRFIIDKSEIGNPVEIKNVAYHERHPSSWESPDNRYRIKGQLHNLNLARQWMQSNQLPPHMIGL